MKPQDRNRLVWALVGLACALLLLLTFNLGARYSCSVSGGELGMGLVCYGVSEVEGCLLDDGSVRLFEDSGIVLGKQDVRVMVSVR